VLPVLLELVLEFRRKGFPVPGIEQNLCFVEQNEAVFGLEDLGDIFEVGDSSSIGPSNNSLQEIRLAISFEVKNGVAVNINTLFIVAESVADHVEGLSATGLPGKGVDHNFHSTLTGRDSPARGPEWQWGYKLCAIGV